MPSILTSVSSLSVPEGGTATFQVKLGSRPSYTTTVSVSRSAGDSNVSVAAGASLSFSRSNYNTWQTVTLAAAEDTDQTNGTATIRCSASGWTSADVTATEADNDLPAFAIVLDRSSLTVNEGSTAIFNVKLSASPGANVTVTTGRASGDADLTVAGGGTLTFTTSNWSTYQPVTIAAAEDADFTGGSAVFAVSCPGAATVNLSATEADNDSASSSVVIDPVSRIEGHLRIQVEVGAGKVSKAFSTATLFRGIEPMLTGRAPTDAPLIVQRLCGVCTYVHGVAGVAAIENANGVAIPDNARLVRNLLMGAQYLHDHIVHFYHLHGLDWIDVISALSASASATQSLAASVTPGARAIDFAAVKTRLQGLADTGNLGIFANGYWGHSAYKLSPEENLLLVGHYLEALKVQVTVARMMAILGGKNPHPQSTVVGGVTCGGELAAGRLAQFSTYLNDVRDFVTTIYLPGVKLVATRYPEYASLGGCFDFLAYGEFPLGPAVSDLFLPRGRVLGGDVTTVYPVDPARITEHVARSWYTGTTALNPASGQTSPAWTGLDVNSRYSWSKAPRYDGKALEVGPLARVMVAYAANQPQVKAEVTDFLLDTGLTAGQLCSTLGRTAARAIETRVIGEAMPAWVSQLQANVSGTNKAVFTNWTMNASRTGLSLTEAPRGALGHWINIDSGKKIGNYQMVVPSTWNFGPRDAAGNPGPLEKAMEGLSLEDPDRPLEVLRLIHAFDPCIACGVHCIDVRTGAFHDNEYKNHF